MLYAKARAYPPRLSSDRPRPPLLQSEKSNAGPRGIRPPTLRGAALPAALEHVSTKKVENFLINFHLAAHWSESCCFGVNGSGSGQAKPLSDRGEAMNLAPLLQLAKVLAQMAARHE
jgi:hypothetical protein